MVGFSEKPLRCRNTTGLHPRCLTAGQHVLDARPDVRQISFQTSSERRPEPSRVSGRGGQISVVTEKCQSGPTPSTSRSVNRASP